MSEDKDASKNKKLFKSKWGRVFKEKEDHEIAGAKHTNSFKLNEDVINADVADFLKPSTEKAATRAANLGPAPKIDIAIAQRFPDAHGVKGVNSASTTGWSATTPGAGGLNGFTKPMRRKGLQVGFAKTAPEVMGEGGDECMDMVTEIAKRKAVRGRSVSDMRQLPDMASVARAATSKGRQQQQAQHEDFRPPPMRRAQTGGEEYAPMLQRVQASQTTYEPEPAPRRPSRTPTGFDVPKDARFGTTDHDDDPSIPQIRTDFSGPQTSGPEPSLSKTREFDQTAERRRSLRASEGMALRRASVLVNPTASGPDRRTSMNFGVQPPAELYEALSRDDAPEILPEPISSSPNALSAASPDEPSPFADPKYMKQRSRDVTPNPPPAREPRVENSSRQQKEAYQPSYMRAVQPPTQLHDYTQPSAANIDKSRSSDENEEPSHLQSRSQQANRPPVPQVHPPPVQLPVSDQQPQIRAPQAQYSDSSTIRSSPTTSQGMVVPRVSIRDKSRSPLHEGMFDQIGTSEQSRSLYSRPNASNQSVNFSVPSPRFAHSRTNSQESNSVLAPPVDADRRRQMSPRFQAQSQSPQSPRSVMLGHSGNNSPYGHGPSPAHIQAQRDYFPQAEDQHVPQPRVPAIHQQQGNPSSRPNTSDSNPPAPFAVPKSTGSPTSQLPIFRNRQSGGFSRPQSTASLASLQGGHAPGSREGHTPNSKSGAGYLREVDAHRPGSSGSDGRPAISPQPPAEGNPQADLAFSDFASRVAHMKGVFRLTAEKERPSDRCAPHAWLRTALWWYLRGKAGLESLLQHRPRSSDGQVRELLAQPHVDLAKTWWILSDPLEPYDTGYASPQSAGSHRGTDPALSQSVAMLLNHLKTLSLAMGKNQLMPPHQSLIQGQDTQIWLEYPRFASDASSVLGGMTSKSYIADHPTRALTPLEALPLGETREAFCYGRFLVEASMSTDEAGTDRVSLPCMLSMMRRKQDFLTTIVIASQNEVVNLQVSPRTGDDKGLSWHDVSWKTSASSIALRLPRNFDLNIRMQEKDLRTLWNVTEYARKVERNLRAGQDETLVHEAKLLQLQYADSSGSGAFPTDKIRGATALLFERHTEQRDGGGVRKLHRGHRLVLLTDSSHKSMSSISHELGSNSPLFFEFMTDSAAGGTAAMVLRMREEQRQSRTLLVFPDVPSRQTFYDVLNGLTVGEEEQIIARLALTSMNIEPATQFEGYLQNPTPALKSLQWQKLGITNGIPEDSDMHQMPTVMSESLRLLARHASGCITDRLNFAKGELQLRLPCGEVPAIQMLRKPQDDITVTIDTRHSQAGIVEGLSEIFQLAHQRSTVRTLTFATHADLHAFQAAVTGCTVRYDGLAVSFGIKRRMMYVPIPQKWTATTVRMQIVSHGSNVQVLAFMEDFSHADAMCFQVKSTDNFENIKGDSRGKKWGVRMVDAKFSLPPELEEEKKKKDKEAGPPEPLSGEALEIRVRRRFVNLEGLEYMGEHDDITVGFETQEERDRFTAALPAATSVSRGLTLKRRI